MVKKHKLLVASALAISSAFIPLPGTAAYADPSSYTVTFTANAGHTVAAVDGDDHRIRIDSTIVELSGQSGATGDVSCSGNTCTITVANGETTEIVYNSGGSNFELKSGDACSMSVNPGDRFNRNFPITISDREPELFTGKIWFFWNCDGGFCKSLITNIDGTEDVEDTPGHHAIRYHTKYVSQADIVDATTGKKPNMSSLNSSDDNYRILWESVGNTPASDASLDTWEKYVAWESPQIAPAPLVTCTNGEGDSYQYDPSYDALKRFRIDPTGAQKGKNIISTNGDRAFRLTIYDPSNYFGVTNAANPEDLTYYPDFWDEGMFNPAYDVSGTTATDPQTMQAYLLSSTVVLESDEKSVDIDNIEVASEIVPGAVNITQTGTKWNISFNSNYYDQVVFKITAGTKSYYLKINRLTISPVMPDPWNGNISGAKVYFPEGDEGNYDVLATYYLADNAEKTVKLEKVDTPQQGGKGLKAQLYRTPASAGINFSNRDSRPRGVSFTVIRSGSTPTNYKGTLAGSGRGTFYTFSDAGTIFGKQF